MRPRVPWMNETDDAVLELLRELEVDGARIALPPTAICLNLQEMGALDRAPNTISRRVKKLAEMNLVDTSSMPERLNSPTERLILPPHEYRFRAAAPRSTRERRGWR